MIWRILKIFFWPSGYTLSDVSQISPFLRVLMRDTKASTFKNPSLAALIDYKWYKAKSHFINHFLIYFLFFAAFNSNININKAFLDENFHTNYFKMSKFTSNIIFYYLGYYLIAKEIIQLSHYGIRRYASVYNIFDCASVIMPIVLVTYLNFNYLDMTEQDLKNLTVAISFTTLILWSECVSIFIYLFL